MTDQAIIPFEPLPPPEHKYGKNKRTRKRTVAAMEHLIALLAGGNTRRAACDAVGISMVAFYNWMDNKEFSADVLKAEAEAHIASVDRIRRAAVGGQVIKHIIRRKKNRDGSEEVTEEVQYSEPNVQVDQWYLERKYPDQWGRKDRVSHEIVSDAAHKLGTALGIDPMELIASATALAEQEELDALKHHRESENANNSG